MNTDPFKEYDYTGATNANGGFNTYTKSTTTVGGTDGIIDYFQLDTTMDNEEFRNVYRRNVWYEAPVAKNYHARHSIHSRRMFHQAKDIVIPLDILPFGYSISSSLPSAALSSECGYIKLTLHSTYDNTNVINVIPIACDECPLGGYHVTDECRGCIAHRCINACPKKCITFDEKLRAHINKELCINCGLCAKNCPVGAISGVPGKEPYHIDTSKCIKCGACYSACRFHAIERR